MGCSYAGSWADGGLLPLGLLLLSRPLSCRDRTRWQWTPITYSQKHHRQAVGIVCWWSSTSRSQWAREQEWGYFLQFIFFILFYFFTSLFVCSFLYSFICLSFLSFFLLIFLFSLSSLLHFIRYSCLCFFVPYFFNLFCTYLFLFSWFLHFVCVCPLSFEQV